MTFAEFKINLEAATAGDKKLPIDAKLIPIVNFWIKQIAIKIKPMQLITSNIKYPLLVKLENPYFIRQPEPIVDDSTKLDIDETLHNAVIYKVAWVYGSKKGIYDAEYKEVINNYRWMRYQALEEGEDV